MLPIDESPNKSRPPSVDNNITQDSPSKVNLSPTRSPLGPVVVFIARASNLTDHSYPNATMTTIQMHEYIRSLLVITVAEHRKRFGVLGLRPHKMQTIIQPAHTRIPTLSRIGKYLKMALEEARSSKSECIFVLHGWDGWTTDKMTIAELCESFRDVPFSFHVYANRGTPREFYEVNGHKVNAYFRHTIPADDPAIVGDRSTALFIRMLEALPTLGYARYYPVLSAVERETLANLKMQTPTLQGPAFNMASLDIFPEGSRKGDVDPSNRRWRGSGLLTSRRPSISKQLNQYEIFAKLSVHCTI
ncbi:hypothetical protein VN97_g5249 [Penicillium thymicola]|uniref:Uncharacterized protein n=1 Tax=Penicillium thymicola TaxID=293382 RepID=A0AAI9X9E1_PENTH|nr:hypothetical protein VN97_g5249 [Penicillium thymicola]